MTARCPDCGTQWGASVRACPSCGRLVHAAALAELAATARAARSDGRLDDELEAWRRARDLLPPESEQARKIGERVTHLEASRPAASTPAPSAGRVPKWLGGLGAVGLLAWKAKAIVLFLFTKGKLLLTGLASWQTALSMLVSFGVYWAAWGWAFAAGLLLSLYVHELGHVVALRRYGIRASAPMFLPGIGAYVRLDQHPETPTQDARVGLAGPWFGLGAAAVAYLLYLVTDAPLLGAIAKVGAWLNLFNLLPVWQLDGGRAFRSLARAERWLCAATLGGAWLLTSDTLLGVVAAVAALRALGAPGEGDRVGAAQYVALVVALSALAALEVPTP